MKVRPPCCRWEIWFFGSPSHVAQHCRLLRVWVEYIPVQHLEAPCKAECPRYSTSSSLPHDTVSSPMHQSNEQPGMEWSWSFLQFEMSERCRRMARKPWARIQSAWTTIACRGNTAVYSKNRQDHGTAEDSQGSNSFYQCRRHSHHIIIQLTVTLKQSPSILLAMRLSTDANHQQRSHSDTLQAYLLICYFLPVTFSHNVKMQELCLWQHKLGD